MRRYYSDALAAAWMAKHFGMRFVWPDNKAERRVVLPAADEPFYIHPDSLSLLKPLVGDEVLYKAPGDEAGCWIWGSVEAEPRGYAEEYGRIKHLQIIRRSNRIFHWPEQEAT